MRLRRAGRPRRVDEREQVVLADVSARLFDCTWVRPRVLAAALAQALQAGEREHVAELGPFDQRQVFVALDEDADGARVFEDVAGVSLRRRWVDRRGRRADVRKRVVEEDPLEARVPEDSERVAFPDPEREQAVGELVDGLRGLLPRDLTPAVGLLDEVRGSIVLS